MNNSEILFLLNTALRAGNAIMEVYTKDDLGVEIKQDDSPLTQADLASNRVITDALKTTDLPILSEEGRDIPYEERKHWDRFWLVDPLDGTKEFIKRNGEFTVNIALIENGEPIFGVIYAPEPDLMYFGGSHKRSARLANVSKEQEISEQFLAENTAELPAESNENDTFRIVASRSHRNEETEQFIAKMEQEHNLEFVPKGSSLKFCVVAEGGADCYPRFAPTMEWDTGAGHAIAIGAGCIATKKDGSPLVYNKENLLNPYFIVNRD